MKSHCRFSEVSAVLCLFMVTGQVFANPTGESLRAGRARFDRSAPGSLSIHQDTDRLIINWRDFSIAAGETTRFIQPSATSIALNRVVTGNHSRLFGSLEANGKVYLINPNGILVGRGGAVNTRGFVASTLDVSDASFLSTARLKLSGDSEASVVNEGSIQAIGGDVFLVGRTVENSGTIRAGTAGLGAGSEVMIVPTGRERLSVIAGSGHADKGVNNEGTIEAVSAELKAAGGNIYALAINNGGIIRATGVRRAGGRVFLSSDGGDIENSGTIVANNANGSGGFVSLAGGHNAANPSTVFNTGVIEARAEASGTRGGEVRLTGDYVGLFGASVIDVSGHSRGGTALIGGDYQGANPQIQNAQRTSVGPNAVIRADALSSGNGGKVILWADETTRFYGSISARGGQRSGDGGFVETSGKLNLEFRGTADLRASHGKFGTLLLDPQNVVIADVDAPPGSADDAEIADATINGTDGAGTFTISRGALEALSGSADILIEATDNITIDPLGGDDTLNLLTGAGNSVTFRADSDNDGTGDFTISGSGDKVMTLGGDLFITGNTVGLRDLETGGGSITIRANELTFGATTVLDAGSGNVTIETKTAGTAITLGTGTGGLDISDANLDKVDTTGIFQIGNAFSGDITITDNLTQGSKNISLVTGGDILNTAGTLTTSGSVSATAGGSIGTLANPFSVSTDDLTVTSGGGVGDDIFVEEANGLTALNLNAGAGNVSLNVLAGDVFDTDGAVDITAADATVTLSGDFGAVANPIQTSVGGLSVDSGNGNQFITEANGLTALDLDAGNGNVTLVLTEGAVTDADGAIDITADVATVTLTDTDDSGDAFGALLNPIGTSVNVLSVDTSAGATDGNQFITEADGLTGLNLNAGAGNVTLVLTEGAISDTDGTDDLIANIASVTLADTDNNGDDFGTLANPIGTSVNDLMVDTSAGTTDGDQFITEANGLTALNLNAGGGNVTLELLEGAITDADVADDIIANIATVTLTDTDDSGDAFGTLANPIGTSVNDLRVDTSAGATDGDQFITEANGLTGLTLNAGAADLALILTLGGIADTDGTTDITADQVTVTLLEGTAQDFGASGDEIATSVSDLTVNTSVGGGNQFIIEADGLTALNLNAGAGNVTLALTEGAITDTDAADDIVANLAAVTLTDTDDSGDAFGTLVNPIGTSVSGLTVSTSAGATDGDQFITEADGLTAVNLNAGGGNVTLVLTEGAISDTDAADDIIANVATVTLTDTDDSGDAFGTLVNPIGTSVSDLTVNTAAGATDGDQFITEANGLTALNLNAGAGNVTLAVAEGAVSDTDAADDVIASIATITLSDANDNGDDFGTLANPIGTAVNELTVTTSAGASDGDQFVTEADGLSGLNLNAGAGDVNLTLTLGSLLDTDGLTDITANQATITLLDVTAQAFGTSGDEIATSVDDLTVNTSAGGGDQFLIEVNGLTGLDLNAGAGNVTLTLTEGSVTDTVGANDIVANVASVTLTDTDDSGDDFGTLANPIGTSVDDLMVNTAAGAIDGDQFITEADGLTAVELNAGGGGNVTLFLTEGAISDTDGTDDIIANIATVTLNDANDGGDAFGALLNPIGTMVNDLRVNTSAGATAGDQFIVEAHTLTGLELNAGAGNVTLTLTEGAISDTDGTDDLIANIASVTLADTDNNGDDFGALANPIGTSVNDLTVDTSAGTTDGDQFITEANGLTALNLNAGAGNVNLRLTLGAVTDADAATDITATDLTVTLSDAAAQNFGASAAQRIRTSVGTLSVDTSMGDGSQFIVEASGLTGLNLNADGGSVDLTAGGALTDTDPNTDIDASAVTVALTGAGAIGSSANPIEIDASGPTVTLDALGAGGGVHVELAQAGALTVTDSQPHMATAFRTLFQQNPATVFDVRYASDLTIRVNGDIRSAIAAGSSLLVPGTLTLNAVGGKIGRDLGGGMVGGIADPFAIDAGTLNATAGNGLSFLEAGNVTLGSISSASGAFFIRAGDTLTFDNSTVIDAGAAGTAFLVADGSPGVSVVGTPAMNSRFLLYALNAALTDPPVIIVGGTPAIGGLTADEINSPIDFDPITPDPFGDMDNHFVFSLEANPPSDPSLFIDIPVEIFQPVSIVFGEYDPAKFGELGDLWMSSSELYEIERKAGKARKALPTQVNRAKYVPPGN